MNLNIVYAIPGMGVDHRIFSKLSIHDFHPVKWLEPHQDESLDSYAQRMLDQIPGSDFILMGFSLGGVVAQEMCRYRKFRGLVLISSIIRPDELSFALKSMQILPYYRLSSGKWRILLLPIWGKLFGITDQEEIKLLQDMFGGFTDNYRFWAIDQLIHWRGSKNIGLPPTLRLHGTQDPLFPAPKVDQALFIDGGDHLMIYRKATEISMHIHAWISEL